MASYGQGSSWEEAAAAGAVGVVLLIAIAIAVAFATTVIVLLTEIGRVYQARALHQGRTSNVLWIALAGLCGSLLAGGVLASHPATQPAGLYLCSWSFLGFVVIVEACDLYEKRFDPVEIAPPEVTVDHLIAPWQDMPETSAQVGASTASTNGHRQTASVT